MFVSNTGTCNTGATGSQGVGIGKFKIGYLRLVTPMRGTPGNNHFLTNSSQLELTKRTIVKQLIQCALWVPEGPVGFFLNKLPTQRTLDTRIYYNNHKLNSANTLQFKLFFDSFTHSFDRFKFVLCCYFFWLFPLILHYMREINCKRI